MKPKTLPTLAALAVLSLVPAVRSQDPVEAPEAGQEGTEAKPAQDAIQRDEHGVPKDTEMKTTGTGLKYCVLRAGAEGAAKPKVGDYVKVHYTGWLTDGKKFDSSAGRSPFQFEVGRRNVILGWDEALQLMPVGSVFKLVIPPDLAYGEMGNPPVIPAKSTLVFEVELLEIVPVPEFRPLDDTKTKTTDSGLKYQVLQEGKGDAVVDDDILTFKFAFFSADGKLIDWTGSPQWAGRGGVGNGICGKMRLQFFNEAFVLLRPGSKCLFQVPAALAFGEAPPPGLPVKKGEDTYWELEIVGVKKPLPVPAFAMPKEDDLKKTESGLKYVVEKAGDPDAPMATFGSKVKVHYAGWLTNGTLFDASYKTAEPLEFEVGLSPVIKGWHEGLQLMRKGAVYTFVIPHELAYGEQGAGGVIPPKATLVFRIELLEVTPLK
ncbi:MAG: FKBP-type peptidyl-prolyl cis-trans isomerase [Planctomycetota bacterium]